MHSAGMARTGRDGHELLGSLSVTLARRLGEIGVDPREANGVAIQVFADLKRHFGRETIYIPSGRMPVLQRAGDARAMWIAGKTVREIARALGCTQQWTYKLLGLELARLRAAEDARDTLSPNGEATCHAT